MGKSMAKDKKKSIEFEIIEGSGNVFEDLQLADADKLLAKSELVGRIADIIKQRRLTQAQAATILGIDQPKVSALLNGKLGRFSLDRLFRFLSLLDQDIEIVVCPTRRHHPGKIAVSAKSK